MKYDIVIPVAIVATIVLGLVNAFLHFMPYSAPPVLLMFTVAAIEVFDTLRNR